MEKDPLKFFVDVHENNYHYDFNVVAVMTVFTGKFELKN